MIQKTVLGLVVVVILLTAALAKGWSTNRADIDLLTRRLAVTQAALADSQARLANAQLQINNLSAMTTTVDSTQTTLSQRLEQLRTSVNHLCNVVAGNSVAVSPLSGQYTIC